LRALIGAQPRLRKQRGSHLVFPYEKLPLNKAVTLFHPRDRRALFAIPWEGVTIIGTTDIDHDPISAEVNGEPFASCAEIDYLLECVQHFFPACHLDQSDVIATFAGVRPIINTGASTPSKESRAHAIWVEKGLITITGGKLTIFRVMASQVMKFIRVCFPDKKVEPVKRFFPPSERFDNQGMNTNEFASIQGKSGHSSRDMLQSLSTDDINFIPDTPYKWADLRRAACQEGVVHLDDLLLRRIRLGLICRNGGMNHMERIRARCQPELGWSDDRWLDEELRYRQIWNQAYSPEPGFTALIIGQLIPNAHSQ